MKKYDIINSFNPDVPDENFFIIPNLLIVEKKPFPETDHIRKRLLLRIFCCLTFDALYAIIKKIIEPCTPLNDVYHAGAFRR